MAGDIIFQLLAHTRMASFRGMASEACIPHIESHTEARYPMGLLSGNPNMHSTVVDMSQGMRNAQSDMALPCWHDAQPTPNSCHLRALTTPGQHRPHKLKDARPLGGEKGAAIQAV
jgi:hypothetical protein